MIAGCGCGVGYVVGGRSLQLIQYIRVWYYSLGYTYYSLVTPGRGYTRKRLHLEEDLEEATPGKGYTVLEAHRAAPTPEPSLAMQMCTFLSPSGPIGDRARACLSMDLKPG